MGESRSVRSTPVHLLAPRNIALQRDNTLTGSATARQELVQWLNSLLLLNITKVEQCGTG